MDTKLALHPIRAGSLSAPIALAVFLSSPALAEGVDAGTLIENTAQATYEDASGSRTISSNTVTVRVDELLDVTLSPLDTSALEVGPGDAVLTFELTNKGNGPESFELVANPAVAGNDFDVTIDALAVDSNGNGTYDPGVDEILAAPETTRELAAGEALTIFVLSTVPDGIADGSETDVELTANAATGTGAAGTVFAGEGDGGGDAIVGTTGASALALGQLQAGIASVDLTKAVSLADPFGGSSAVPGSIASFTITADVSGSGSVEDLVVSDAIPDGTTYAAGTLALDGAKLSDPSDADAGSASDADGVRVDLGDVAAGTSHAITFDVIVN
ncbi:MAG: hypothetical protein RIC51_04315 [Erythrobacter sp.]|uniref:hypothetical protein n=1 Tax=Erythrobacter sp. TaxID=1042 RepID=UPI0032EDD4D8